MKKNECTLKMQKNNNTLVQHRHNYNMIENQNEHFEARISEHPIKTSKIFVTTVIILSMSRVICPNTLHIL